MPESLTIPVTTAILGSVEATFPQPVWVGVIEDAEEPILAAPRTGQPDLVEPAHVAMHRLPVATAAELRRRRVAHSFQDSVEPSLDLRRTGIQEVLGRHLAVLGLEVDDPPRHPGAG